MAGWPEVWEPGREQEAVELEEIAVQLESLGLDPDQSSVYVALLQVGPCKVSELAAEVDVSRTTLYRVLDTLCDRGFATKSLERPTVYTAAPPGDVFDTRISQLDTQRDRLEELKGPLVAQLQELQAPSEARTEHHWKRLEGAWQIYETILTLVGRAENRLDLVSNDRITLAFDRPEVEDAWRVGRDSARAGAATRVLLDVDDPPGRALPSWARAPTAQFRRFESDRAIHFLLVDASDVVVWTQPARSRPSPEEAIALWTDAPGLVAPLQALFDALWERAEPANVPRE